MSVQTKTKRHSLRSLQAMKGVERVAMLTAYDVTTAHCLDQSGVDILLIGDSLGNVVYGMDSTLPVTMEMILAHTQAVARGSERALVISDLPFMSYQASEVEALRNAGLCLSVGGAQAVKMEGASPYILNLTRRMVDIGIPVMGHIGLTPQSIHQMGGYYTHGKDQESFDRLVKQAIALDEAGCFSIVLECVKEELALEITKQVKSITIGIGSGKVCDGEVLVIHDILGYTLGKAPKFAEAKLNLKELVSTVAREYVEGVKKIYGNKEKENRSN